MDSNTTLSTSTILHGNCIDIMPTLTQRFRACITSPPYAMQRSGGNSMGTHHYEGVPEAKYPEWTVSWLEAMRPRLTEDANILIVIRSHVRNGSVSDYVLRTRLAVREAGWFEPEELMWLKLDAPPLGHQHRPRRCSEHILWYSPSRQPYVHLTACGKATDRIGFVASTCFGSNSPISQHQNHNLREGRARIPDVLTAPVGGIARNVMHAAMFPQALSDILVQTFAAPGDWVIDPFVGSGTTALSCQRFGRSCVGIDLDEGAVGIARSRIEHGNKQAATGAIAARGAVA